MPSNGRALEPTQVSNYLPTIGCLSNSCVANTLSRGCLPPFGCLPDLTIESDPDDGAAIPGHDPDQHSVPPRSTALESVSPAGRHRSGYHLDSRRTRSHYCGFAGSCPGERRDAPSFQRQSGAVASFYVVGAVIGALVFGWITDRHGRRLVFYVTLMVYLSGVLLSAFAWDFWSFAIFRMVTGLGIGGGYAAGNSAIRQLIP